MALSQTQFSELVADHGPILYRLAYRLVGNRSEAEDAVQETFRSVWKSRAKFDPTRGTRAWLTTILRRRVADFYRRRARPHLAIGDGDLEISSPEVDPTAEGFTDEMQQALGRLPPEWRETLLLVVVAELTHQEAADALGVPLGTVLSRVSRARGRMREYLGQSTANGLGLGESEEESGSS